MYSVINLSKITGFEWDKGNLDKSYQKHGISINETEQVFTDEDVQIEKDIKHQEKEERYIAIGKDALDKILFIVFTIRRHKMSLLLCNKIRVISARIANKKERRLYEERVKKNPQIYK